MKDTDLSRFKILVVDDEPTVIDGLKQFMGFDPSISIQSATTANAAIELVRTSPYQFALILMDYRLPDMSGADATKEILKLNPDQIIAMNSGDESREAAIESWQAGAVDYIEKRWSPDKIKSRIVACLQKYRESSELYEDQVISTAPEVIQSVGIIGASAELAKVSEKIKKAAASEAPVLILGESGVGKEEVAKAVHRNSKRNQMNFVVENMTAIPSELFESTLFGHVKGAFTGALFDRPGLLKKAHGGTLFLDEIGDMKLDQQVKLLRVLQTGEFYPVGSNKLEKVNVRIISATNVNLNQAMFEKRFREDLFFRLNTFEILVPPLRQRPEDIRPLIEHFKKIKNYRGKVILLEAVKKLERYNWPGNVRELFAELTKLFEYFKDEPKITLKHLDAKFFEASALNPKSNELMSMEELKTIQRTEEVNLIKSHLKKYKNVRDAASEGLKIPYTTLFSKLKSLKIIEDEQTNLTGGI